MAYVAYEGNIINDNSSSLEEWYRKNWEVIENRRKKAIAYFDYYNNPYRRFIPNDYGYTPDDYKRDVENIRKTMDTIKAVTPTVVEATGRFVEYGKVEVFIEENIEYDSVSTQTVEVDDVYSKYQKWCLDKGNYPVSKERFAENVHDWTSKQSRIEDKLKNIRIK